MFWTDSKEFHPYTVETQPQKGQLITSSKWQFNNGHVLKILVICQNEKVVLSNPDELLNDYNQYLKTLGQLQENTREVVEAVYRFIIKAFTRKVNNEIRQGY
ncbi:unnamed protein product, partial [marine sediment metagenome]